VADEAAGKTFGTSDAGHVSLVVRSPWPPRMSTERFTHAPVGRFGWRRALQNKPVEQRISEEAEKFGEGWIVIQSGLFTSLADCPECNLALLLHQQQGCRGRLFAVATASWIAKLIPTPPAGDIACAASPMCCLLQWRFAFPALILSAAQGRAGHGKPAQTGLEHAETVANPEGVQHGIENAESKQGKTDESKEGTKKLKHKKHHRKQIEKKAKPHCICLYRVRGDGIPFYRAPRTSPSCSRPRRSTRSCGELVLCDSLLSSSLT
jgi:hypothetical protein